MKKEFVLDLNIIFSIQLECKLKKFKKINERKEFKHMDFSHDYFTHNPGYVPSGKNLFVSTVNGFDQEVSASLQKILQGPTIPEYIFWLGDMSATKMLTDLESMFDDIHRTMKRLLKQNRRPDDNDILSIIVKNDVWLADVCKKMRGILKVIDPTHLSYSYLADLARDVSKFKNFNQFINSLHSPAKKAIQNDQIENAVNYISLMTQFAKKGSQVIIIEGDKDINCPFNFQFKKFLASTNKRIQYFDKPKVIGETDECIFVVWPYNSKPSDIPHLDNPSNKKVVIVSHSPFVREAVMGTNPMKKIPDHVSKRDKEIDTYMLNVAQQLGVKFGVHGHLHKPIDCGKYDAYRVTTMTQRLNEIYVYYIYNTFKAIDF